MRIELICVGHELLYGKLNTHIAYIGEHLSDIGLQLNSARTIPDDLEEMTATFKDAFVKADITIITGGLGPTFDDLTREAAAKALNKKLIRNEELLKKLEQYMTSRGYKFSLKGNENQAYLIEGAKTIENKFGTAPGQFLEHNNKLIVILPGPPKEMHTMFESFLAPLLKNKYCGIIAKSKTIHIFGLGESKVNEIIKPIIETERKLEDGSVSFTILAHLSGVNIKTTVTGTDSMLVDEIMHSIKAEFYRVLKDYIYGEDAQTLESIVGDLLIKHKSTLSVAESCTGGLIANRLTNIPGSSLFFQGGIVSYSNHSKIEILKVNPEVIDKNGAVSEPTALEMAKGAKALTKSDYAVAISGIAGPSGGTPEKPVGTVCFALVTPKKNKTETVHFIGTRLEIKERSANHVFNILRLELQAH
ncbi:MAG: competence/damage-inducible protein A [Elusimicrobia bacterium]|nr:competence/damage-inducible protein A [Elusimicrobiota bacterium]